MEDIILIAGLELFSRVGVPEGEREQAQRLTAELRLEPARGCSGLGDRLEQTVDYAAVRDVVLAQAALGSRRLLETLAEELALLLLERFPLRAVEVELRKYVLPQTRFVAVRLRREARG